MTTLAIAGWRIRLECTLPAFDEAVAARYRDFVAPDGAANDAWVTVTLDPDIPGGEWPARLVTRQGDICYFDDFCEGGGVGACGDGDSDEFTACGDEMVYLPDTAVDVGCIDFCH